MRRLSVPQRLKNASKSLIWLRTSALACVRAIAQVHRWARGQRCQKMLFTEPRIAEKFSSCQCPSRCPIYANEKDCRKPEWTVYCFGRRCAMPGCWSVSGVEKLDAPPSRVATVHRAEVRHLAASVFRQPTPRGYHAVVTGLSSGQKIE
jgi:hypothetical protein